jgi:hypothetical protein
VSQIRTRIQFVFRIQVVNFLQQKFTNLLV